MHTRLRGVSKWVALASIVAVAGALASPAGADVTSSFRHLWREHIKPKLAKERTFNAANNPIDWSGLKNVPLGDPGAINDADNPVDWTQLKNVPSGFADGIDNDAANGGGAPPPPPPAAPAGIVGLEVVKAISAEDTKNAKGMTAACPAGKSAIGGGAVINGPAALNAALQATQPTAGMDGWTAYAHEHTETAGNWSIEVTAVCAPQA
jgi:hypothetical protein